MQQRSMERIYRSAKSLLSPTSESPKPDTSPSRPTVATLASDTAIPSLGHDGFYGHDTRSTRTDAAVATENKEAIGFSPLKRILSLGSPKAKSRSMDMTPLTVVGRFHRGCHQS